MPIKPDDMNRAILKTLICVLQWLLDACEQHTTSAMKPDPANRAEMQNTIGLCRTLLGS